jgi:hypothetical protein
MFFVQPRFFCRAFARPLYRRFVETSLDCQLLGSRLTFLFPAFRSNQTQLFFVRPLLSAWFALDFFLFDPRFE